MIKSSALVCLLLLVAYDAFIVVVKPSTANITSYQQNLYSIQDYLFQNEKDNVLAGSSLTKRINTGDYLKNNFYNFSLEGRSSLEVLDVIVRSERFPKNILIEVNTPILKPFYNKLQKESFSFFSLYGKRYVHCLRERYRPVNVIYPHLAYVHAVIQYGCNKYIFSRNFRNTEEVSVNPSAETPAEDIKKEYEIYFRLPDEDALTENMERLKKYVDTLKKKNVNVIFYELPIREELCKSPLEIYLRKRVRDYFPESEYTYLPVPDCAGYETSDGEHLAYFNPNGDVKYSKYFEEHISKLLK